MSIRASRVLDLIGLCALLNAASSPAAIQTAANVPTELSFTARQHYTDAFNAVELDITFTDPAGMDHKVPAFWGGGDTWKVRYASDQIGIHHWRSACNRNNDAGLHNVEGAVEVTAYTGDNPLFRHGPIRVSTDKRHLEHADGTPFFWLGDTWWMGLCHRLHWPNEFAELTADRKAKGFNVIQMVAGLYPDMFPFDPRGANEAGYPWETNYARMRPEYFDAADQRLRYLVDQGFTPCLVGAWGYFMPWMGVPKMKQHWRYLIARYGSWPVIWCAAGEANLPWYLAKGFPYDDRQQVHDWTEVARYIRATDPFHRLLTVHPTGIGRLSARHAIDDTSLLDFDMLQTPHGQREAVAPTIRTMRESYPDHPTMPVINGEASYEMLMDRIPAQWPRAMFWLCMVNGAAGHTYGANGIWQLNRREKPHGASPNGTGNGYGVIPWNDAMHLPGSQQVSFGKRFLESLPWTKLVPMPDTATWADTAMAQPHGDWIWYPEGDPKRDAPVAARYFRRSFVVPAASIRRAQLWVAADDQFSAWINGKLVASGADWHKPTRANVAALLVAGTNVLAIRAENSQAPVKANPAGLTAALRIETDDGKEMILRTDDQWRAAKVEAPGWRASAFDDSTWPQALLAAKFGDGPWGAIGTEEPLITPQACGIADELRVIYALDARPIIVRALKPGTTYRATRFDPVLGHRRQIESVQSNPMGEARIEAPAEDHDWVVLLER